MSRKRLPPWLEANWLFRKLFLLKKALTSKSRRQHFGQFAEDVAVLRLIGSRADGFYVDVGCFHPKKFSNTWQLYKAGWRGVNIDLDSIKIELFEMMRPRDTNITRAVSDRHGEVTFYSHGLFSPTTSLAADFMGGKHYAVPRTIQSTPLTEILDETEFRGRPIDFLSVDAEGHDLQVLQSLDFERYKPQLIAVESHDSVFPVIAESELYQFLLAKGYSLVGWHGLTLFMASPELQCTLGYTAPAHSQTRAA